MSRILCFARAFLAKDPNSLRARKTSLSGCLGEVGNGRSPAGRADHQKSWLRRGYRAGGALVLALLLMPAAGESLAQTVQTVDLSLSHRYVQEGLSRTVTTTHTTSLTLTAQYSDGTPTPTTATEWTVTVTGSAGAVVTTDYNAIAATTLTIAANADMGTVTFDFVTHGDTDDDAAVPKDVTISVTASTVPTGFTAPATGVTLTITDDDSFPDTILLDLSTSSVTEGDAPVTVTVTAAFPPGSFPLEDTESADGTNNVEVEITVGLSTGTDAAQAADFTVAAPVFTLTITEADSTLETAASISSMGTFVLTVTDDSDFELAETLQVVGIAVSSPRDTTTFIPPARTITIISDDPDTITLSLSPTSVAEGDAAVTVTVTAELSGMDATNRMVEITVGPDTMGTNPAEAADFTAVPAFTITIAGGSLTGTASFVLTVADDVLLEPDGETLLVAGTATTSFEFVNAVLTITEVPPDTIDLSLSPSSVTEGDDPVTVTVNAVVSGTASIPRLVAITVAPNTTGTNAAQAEDFTAVPSFTLTIASGTLTGAASFELTVTDDEEVEPDKTLLVAGTLTSLEIVNNAVLTIVDNDGNPPVVEALLPELGRVYAASVIDAVSGRIEAVASGGLSSSAGHSSLAHRLAANQQNLNDGDLLSLLEESPLAFELGGTGAAGSGGGQAASPSPFGIWASGDYDRVASKSGEMGPWDGRQFTLHAGMDTEISRNALVGVAGSWSKSNFVFDDDTTLETDADLMGLNLYVGGHSGDGKRNVWATVGYGRGDLEVDGLNLETDLKTKMLAVGASNNIAARPGFDLDIKGEISTAQMNSDAVIGTPAVQSRVHRMRAALKIGSTHIYDSGSYLTRSVEGGFRLERGDGDIGSGFEIDGALDWSAPTIGVTATGAANVLLLHSGYLQRSMGVTGRINYAPPHAKGRGLTLRAQPSYGRAESDAGQLWGQEVADLESEDDADPGARLVLNAGWGLPAQSGRDLVTPYSGLELSEGGSRVYRLGSRIEIDSALSINLAGNRKEEGDSPEHGIDLHLRMQW